MFGRFSEVGKDFCLAYWNESLKLPCFYIKETV
jgi:hypothetical protein